MSESRERQDRQREQRGSVLVVALVTLSALLMVATVTLLKVSRGTKALSEAHFQSIALFAAESGVAAGMDYLRSNADPIIHFSALVSPNNSSVISPLQIAGNTLLSTNPSSAFSGDTLMRYRVSILNNKGDLQYAVGGDADGIVVLRSIGTGPGTSRVVVEVEVDGSVAGPLRVMNWRVAQ